jgi:hypothetical protein
MPKTPKKSSFKRRLKDICFFLKQSGDLLMATKPTYEELKQKIKELEKEALERKRVDE